MAPTRRHFLATAGATLLGAAAAGACHGVTRARPRAGVGVGVQLYTLRAAMRSDVSGTLARVAEIGYREVEFAGYFDHTPEQIAALLREHGLAAPSTHIGFDQMRTAWPRALDEAARAGHRYVTVPWIEAGQRGGIEDWKRIAELFNERAAAAREAGLRFAYHNHDFEFTLLGDITPLQLLLAQTEPGLVGFQLDVYWAAKAGADPVDLLARHPGRFVMTHLKDTAGGPEHRMVDVGAGRLDFSRILAAAQAAGVQHHFIEHDQPDDAFASVAAGYRHIAALQNR